MSPQNRVDPVDQQLHTALVDFERSVELPDRAVPLLVAVVGLVRALGALARFGLGLLLDRDRTDPIDLEPRILRS
jgi:hypothetical protein